VKDAAFLAQPDALANVLRRSEYGRRCVSGDFGASSQRARYSAGVEPVLPCQVASEHLSAVPAFKANDIVALNRASNGHSRHGRLGSAGRLAKRSERLMH